MSRRSFRLKSSGYYNSDEESDSSSVTNISYRENPVKVFKKKARSSKGQSKTPTTFKSNGVSGSPSASASQSKYHDENVEVRPSPPTSQPSRGITAPPSICSEMPTPVRSHHAGQGTGQRTMDSSGYSSSENPNRKPIHSATSSTSKSYGSTVTGYRPRINRALFSLMDLISSLVNPIHKIVNVAALAKTPLSSHVKKACGLFLLLFIIFIIVLCGFWFLLSPFTSILLNKDVANKLSQTEREFASHAMDPAVVNTAVEEKMRQVTEKLQRTQEKFLLQLKESVHLDLENMKTRFEDVDLNNRLYLEREHAKFDKQLSDFHSATDSLKLRIQDIETKNEKLSEEWASLKRKPPPAWCPCVSTDSGQTHLSPHFQSALKKWFTDHFRVDDGVMKEQDTLRLIEKGSCSECVYPMADKMPDFALETQGASVISTRCSETYRGRSACVTLFGIPLWYPSESPRTVIQGSPVLLPGKCWAFHGAHGLLVISLSHPIKITHVTLDHLPRYKSPTGRIDSSPKDFEVHGMKNEMEDGTLLGTFTYDEYGEPTQTFELPQPTDEVYRFVELRVLSNWGHMEYTCLYRFRVHGHISK